MSEVFLGSLSFSRIIHRKLDFLLNNKIAPWDEDDKSDLGERDALKSMLKDCENLTEQQFESKYLAELEELKKRSEEKEYSVADGDDYYESYNNTLVRILELINPMHQYDLTDDE